MFYCLFLYGIITWILKNIPARNEEAMVVRVCMQCKGCSKHISAYDGGRGSIISYFGAYVLPE